MLRQNDSPEKGKTVSFPPPNNNNSNTSWKSQGPSSPTPSSNTPRSRFGLPFLSLSSSVSQDQEQNYHSDPKDLGRFADRVKMLRISKADSLRVCSDHEQFYKLQETLREKGAITNTMFKQMACQLMQERLYEIEKQQEEEAKLEELAAGSKHVSPTSSTQFVAMDGNAMESMLDKTANLIAEEERNALTSYNSLSARGDS